MPSAAEAAEAAEARRVLDALNHLILNVGEAYAALSGQAAATQSVVADLRRCASFLQTRLQGEPPPAPWLTAATGRGATSMSTPPPRRSSFGQLDVPTHPSAPTTSPLPHPAAGGPASLRSPSPSAAAPTALETPGSGPCTPAPLAPKDPASRSSPYAGACAAPSGSASRPPLAGGGTPSGGRAGSVGRVGPVGRATPGAPRAVPPAPSRNTAIANLPAAGRPSGVGLAGRARDPSPQRRGVVGVGAANKAGSSPVATSPGAPQVRAPSPAAAATPQPGTGTAMAAAAAPGPVAPPCRTDQAPTEARDASHLPLAAQRAMAAAAALVAAPDSGQQASLQAKPAGLPQLPVPLRRAMQRYRETLQTREQLLRQFQQRRGGGGAAGSASLADTVAASGRVFCTALCQQYPSREVARSNGPGGGPATRASQTAARLQRMSLEALGLTRGLQELSTVELRRRAQVAFSALVAAQTWLTQSLEELARTRGTGGGAAAASRRAAQADTCAALLADVELLRLELDDLQAQIPPAAQSPAPAAGRPGPGPARVAGPQAAAALLSELGVEEELEEAAALWRNRFLRAMLAGAGAGAGPQTSAGRVGGSGMQRRSPGGQPQQQQAQAQLLAGRDAGTCAPRMLPPLGFWLPDAMWAHAPNSAPSEASASTPKSPGLAVSAAATPTTPASPLGLPPWHVLLPPHPATSAAPEAATRRIAPPALLCASSQDAVTHGRAQLQLQATVFQLLLESAWAAPLIPWQRPPQQRGQDAWQRGGHGAVVAAAGGGVAWERWLAQCRLAHVLLFKGAWNRLCSVVELEEEQDLQLLPGGDAVG